MNTCSCDPSANSTAVMESRPTAQELWQRYHQQADTHTENALVEQYLPLVRSAVGRLAITLPDHVDHDDLHSAGLVGLLQALRNYDPACNTSFEGYARVRIRGAMLDELRRMDWVPRTVHEKARRIQNAMAELEQRRLPSTTNCWMKSGRRRLSAWMRPAAPKAPKAEISTKSSRTRRKTIRWTRCPGVS